MTYAIGYHDKFPLDKIILEGRYREDLGNIEELTQSIQEKGLIQPISLNTNGKLLAGGRRYNATKAAGLAEIPAMVRRAEDVLDEKEIELYENIHRKDMTWHERAKAEKEISDLKTAKDPSWTQRDQAQLLDISVGSVNRRIQLAEYLEAVPELKGQPTEEAAWKAVKKIEEGYMADALARQAEVRENGKPDPEKGYAKWANSHFVVGDAFEGMEKLPDKAAHFAEVDPPYAIELGKRKSRSKGSDALMDQYNEISKEDYPMFINRLAEEVHRLMGDNAFVVWWFGVEWYQEVLASLVEAGFKCNPVPAIWYKGNQGQTASPDTSLGSSYETFFVARKGSPKLAKPGRSNVFHYSPVHPGRKIHATEKPMELMVDLLETFLFPGSRVLVPFLGSGVTLRASYRLNHSGFGWDRSKDHKKRFLDRVNEDIVLGIKPKLIKAVGE